MGHDFLVLGPLQVRGGTGVELQRPSHRRLLSILLLADGHRQTTDVLIERFWGDDPPAEAKAALQAHVSALRRLLGSSVITTEGYGYRLPLDDVTTDVAQFERLAGAVHRHERSRAWTALIDAADRALALWRGDPFAELQDDAFAKPEIARLQDLHLEVQAARTAALVACDRHAEVLPDLERLVEEHPLHERFWEQLLVARYRLGRHAEALEAYRRARSVLAELGLEPGTELRRLERRVLIHDRGLDPTPRHDLPVELTSFVGRAREVADVGELLAEHRLVTLTGIGGAGKTRLAQQVAASRFEAFPDGCCLTRLGALRDPDLVAREVATSLGLRPDDDDVTALLCRAVAPERRLIILDNCEHLLEAAAAVARALAEAGPHVRVLATSREALRVPGEVVYEVPPMASPGPHAADLQTLRSYDAVRLFEDRARLARGGYAPAEEDAEVIAAICRRLDGVPLAIELAAARTRVLDVRTIADRLDDRFRLLTGGSSTVPARQRTLEATMTWSYDLLDRAQQLVFARSSVFRGGFDLDAAGSVTGGDGVDPAEAGDLVASLVERSLISAYDTEVGRRYRLLETAREYAADRLTEAGGDAAVRQRHLERYAALAHRLRDELGRRGEELLEQVAMELENLQAALEHADALGRDADVEVLSSVLARHWTRQGHLAVATTHLERALAVCTDPVSEAELRAHLSRERFKSGDVEAAYREASRARELTVGTPPSGAKLEALRNLAVLRMLLVDRDPADAVPVAREALTTAEQLEDVTSRIRARSLLGRALGWAGAIDDGLRHQRLALHDALDDAEPSLAFEMYAHTFELLYIHPTERRDGPRQLTDELLTRFPVDDAPWHLRTHAVVHWLPYVFLQSGDWDRAERAIDQQDDTHLEGFDRTWHLMLRATLRWMQGRTGEARLALEELEWLGVNPRWYHDYLPLVAEVAADEGRLDDVRACATRYLDVAVHASEEAKKLGVLVALVRAEVDAALASQDGVHSGHARRAEDALGLMHQLLETYPPPTAGSVQLETPRTFLRLAEAEVTRLADPDPGAWRDAVASADYVYTRLYAAWRLVEALAAAGGAEEAADDLQAAYAEARAIGADGIADELRDLAMTLHLDVSAAHTGGHRSSRRR